MYSKLQSLYIIGQLLDSNVYKLEIHLSRIMRNPDFAYAKKKNPPVTAKLISVFVFATRIVQFLYFLNPKFPAPNHILCLVCDGPGRNPDYWFSHAQAHFTVSLVYVHFVNIFNEAIL